MEKKKPKFIRTDYWRWSKLGKNRKKLQVWRRARGMHNKLRRRRKGYPAIPLIGYKGAKKDSGKVDGAYPKMVYNVNDLKKVGKHEIAIIASVGARKKVEIMKRAEEMKVRVYSNKEAWK